MVITMPICNGPISRFRLTIIIKLCVYQSWCLYHKTNNMLAMPPHYYAFYVGARDLIMTHQGAILTWWIYTRKAYNYTSHEHGEWQRNVLYTKEVLYTNTGYPNFARDICSIPYFLLITFVTYSIFSWHIFITYLFIIVLVSHNCFNCILCIVIVNVLIVFYAYIWTFCLTYSLLYLLQLNVAKEHCSRTSHRAVFKDPGWDVFEAPIFHGVVIMLN